MLQVLNWIINYLLSVYYYLNILIYKTSNREMESVKINAAMKHYEAVKKASSKYYTENKEKINERRRQRYKQVNPNPKPRGRPKKNIVVEDNKEHELSKE